MTKNTQIMPSFGQSLILWYKRLPKVCLLHTQRFHNKYLKKVMATDARETAKQENGSEFSLSMS